MSGHREIWIAVDTDVAYAAVTDLPKMGQWSSEHLGGEWIGSVRHAAVGAIFRGQNRDSEGEWETELTVIEADPRKRFSFCVAPPGEVGTVWTFTFHAERGGTIVTEAFEWHWTPGDGFRGRVGEMPLDEAAAAVADREHHLCAQIRGTLAALKRALEDSPRVKEQRTQ